MLPDVIEKTQSQAPPDAARRILLDRYAAALICGRI